MKTKWAYILIGNNQIGKTTFQKHVVLFLTGFNFVRLTSNKTLNIVYHNGLRRYYNIFTMGRSFQEKIEEYKTVSNFFKVAFDEADICLLSSHLDPTIIKQMIKALKERFYNVAGVFFTNSINQNLSTNADISEFEWQNRIIIQNDNDSEEWAAQIELNAKEFGHYIATI